MKKIRFAILLATVLFCLSACEAMMTKMILSEDVKKEGVESFPMILTEEELQWIKEKNSDVYKSNKALFQRYVLVHNMFKHFEESIRTFPRDKSFTLPSNASWGESHLKSYSNLRITFELNVWDWGDSKGVIPSNQKIHESSALVQNVIKQRYALHDSVHIRNQSVYLIGDLGTVLQMQTSETYNVYIDRLKVIYFRLPGDELSYQAILNPFPDTDRFARVANYQMNSWRKRLANQNEIRNCRSQEWDAEGNCVAGGPDAFDAHKAYSQHMAMQLMGQWQSQIDSKQKQVTAQQQQIQQNQRQFEQQRQAALKAVDYSQPQQSAEPDVIGNQPRFDVNYESESGNAYAGYVNQIMRMPVDQSASVEQTPKYDTDSAITTDINATRDGRAPSLQNNQSNEPAASGRSAKAVCWQANNGGWFCDGPLQRLWASEGELDRAKKLVHCANSSLIKETQGLGKLAGKRVQVFDCGRPLIANDIDVASDGVY